MIFQFFYLIFPVDMIYYKYEVKNMNIIKDKLPSSLNSSKKQPKEPKSMFDHNPVETFKDKLPNFLKEQIAKYETIFDHNPNEDEIKQDLIGLLSKQNDTFFENLSQEYLDKFNQDFFYGEIHQLYIKRGDKENTNKYFKKLPKGTQEYYNSLPPPDRIIMN